MSKLLQIVRSLQTFFLNMYGRSEIATFVESLPDHVVEWNIDDDESSEDGSSDEYLSDSDPDTVLVWQPYMVGDLATVTEDELRDWLERALRR